MAGGVPRCGIMRFNNMLFPVDFSDRCRAAAPFVNALANKNGALLTLVNFVETPVMWYGGPDAPSMPEFNTPRLIEEADHRLSFFAGEALPGFEPKLVVQLGDPGSCIVELARESSVDLILMPTRGCGRFRAALLGSVTAKVLHDAECAVWTAAHADQPENKISADWRRIVCAVDTNAEALDLIRLAADFHATFGACVHLVHAVPAPAETRHEKCLDRNFELFLEDSARSSIDRMQHEAGTAFPVRVEPGRISTVIASAARDLDADLVLIGRGALTHFGGRLRTHVYAIVRDAPCPVLSV